MKTARRWTTPWPVFFWTNYSNGNLVSARLFWAPTIWYRLSFGSAFVFSSNHHHTLLKSWMRRWSSFTRNMHTILSLDDAQFSDLEDAFMQARSPGCDLWSLMILCVASSLNTDIGWYTWVSVFLVLIRSQHLQHQIQRTGQNLGRWSILLVELERGRSTYSLVLLRGHWKIRRTFILSQTWRPEILGH